MRHRLPFEFFAAHWPRGAHVTLAREQLEGDRPRLFILDVVRAGKFYEIGETEAREVPPTQAPDVVIARRLEDYPSGYKALPGTKVEPCSKCGALLLLSPSSATGVPRVCLQCAGFTPVVRRRS